MKIRKFDELLVKYRERLVGRLSLTTDGKLCCFQYDKEWLIDGFSISPLSLPLQEDIFVAKPTPFAGNFGIFEDSMPDGYGRYLLHKTLLKEGVNDFNLSALDRLSIVGDNGMGALTYSPVNNIVKGKVIDDFDVLQHMALEILREHQDDDVALMLFNSGNSGGARPKATYTDGDGHWLVKFRHTYDPEDSGIQEYKHNEAARRCGIIVPDFKLFKGKYFASRRFDIDAMGYRRHIATAGALMEVSLSQPILDYRNLLALTGYLTHDPADVEQMFRRMVFNYVVENKDDHCKNFSFFVEKNSSDKWKWHLSPAYDLTYCVEGYNGEHATSVNGSGNPTVNDFITLGEKVKISARKSCQIIEEILEGVGDLKRFDIDL